MSKAQSRESDRVQKAPRGLSNRCAKAHQTVPSLVSTCSDCHYIARYGDRAYPCSYTPSLMRCWNVTAACLDKPCLCGALLMNSLA